MKNYKLMALVPLFMLIGCKHQGHKNIIIGISTTSETPGFLLKDVETNQERIYIVSQWNTLYNYLKIGDTVVIVGNDYRQDDYYQKNFVLRYPDAGFIYNTDSVYTRRQRECLDKFKQQMTKTR